MIRRSNLYFATIKIFSKKLSYKVEKSADEAIRDIKDGATIMTGGFGLCGIPETLIDAVRRKGISGNIRFHQSNFYPVLDIIHKELTFVGNDAGVSDYGIGTLFSTNQVD
jgi:acyl CoA:acetate/3-ketoacid CoA transferase alpha subunit